MKKYWDNAVSFLEYMQDTEDLMTSLKNSTTEEEKELHGYYELGFNRMHSVEKTFKTTDLLEEKYSQKQFDGKILIITEAWCGDASQVIPVVVSFFKNKNEVRMISRDKNPELIDLYLTDGARAIPMVLFLDQDFEVISHWGPRPDKGTDLLKKHRENPVDFPKEDFYNELQVYYAKNKGADIISEILEKIQ